MADRVDLDNPIVAQWYGYAVPQPLGDRRALPDVRPREMREPPLGQSNLAHRALSSFGQPSLDALRRGMAGQATPGEVARTFIETGPMAPFGAARSTPASPVRVRQQDGRLPNTYHLALESDVGQLTGVVDPQARSIRAGGALVQEQSRGQGHGVALYQALAERARDLGYVLHSDGPVSRNAARVYEALGRRGYNVERNPSAVIDRSGNVSIPGDPHANAFTVHPTKDALRLEGSSFPDDKRSGVSSEMEVVVPSLQRLDPGYVPGSRESTNVEDRRPKTVDEHLQNLATSIRQPDVQGIGRQLLVDEFLRAFLSRNLDSSVRPSDQNGRPYSFDELRQMYLQQHNVR